ncbi:hypothetical protein [Streptomyces sp. NPDC091383]
MPSACVAAPEPAAADAVRALVRTLRSLELPGGSREPRRLGQPALERA